jgi:hypothetical protein
VAGDNWIGFDGFQLWFQGVAGGFDGDGFWQAECLFCLRWWLHGVHFSDWRFVGGLVAPQQRAVENRVRRLQQASLLFALS